MDDLSLTRQDAKELKKEHGVKDGGSNLKFQTKRYG